MEGRLWAIVVGLLSSFEKYPKLGRYADREILAVVLWAVLHDRPINWACQRENWTVRPMPVSLPHPSTVSRRLHRLEALFQRLHQEVLRRLQLEREAIVDGKSLIISDLSRDPDAKNGRGTRGMARGYKLHAVVSPSRIIEAFEVQPLNANERGPAKRLLRQLPSSVRRVVADGNYDGATVHQAIEGSGVKLYTPIMNGRVGRKSHRRRYVLVRLMQTDWGERLLKLRDTVERAFAQLCNISFGFKGLPSWIRRLHRVRYWISGKVLLHNSYLMLKQQR
jgi:hypothetical protein